MKRAAAAIFLVLAAAPGAAAEDTFASARRELLAEIVADGKMTAAFTGRPRFAPKVLAALAQVPRHRFVPALARPFAYLNRPLPIGHGQTISQPYIVALMTDLLEVEPDHVVLEVGTGSGYQAAVLAGLVARVLSLEIIEPLARQAKARLAQLGYDNVTARQADGYDGWPEMAPFDGIIVTAAADHIPPPLVAQLKPGGRLIIPVGPRFLTQQLVLVEKDRHGNVRTRQILPVRFVPLTGR
ncbi:MAG TPA: protein-L-isoaspartate(D-aspartate) O-methyltransferase [Alphaproteobacteria bacterium]|jgi:protein-L-isoaspartate(D-aspartate) O-methyltransferase|nr:protein-L-isoaspartate(D-aspartate) O-methyltransferase [Alphaproteobacteria bacterium]MDP6272073.1 protein-L-isoaspartate(D-aspartate) O-methyltransferase [Alphaproteobacteria bacterium]MDP7429091.1 protein-L-isoaspartate(D-aspartate) O-methyltransferase [Alphaproteobacteria bacterium]HJM48344.1 protein-L-isoaspartate(D-aspartate) O-methyltransferase [Alphaproteobacteria bacterium]